MTIINNIYLKEDMYGLLSLVGVESNSTFLGKKNAPADLVDQIEEVIYSGDNAQISGMVSGLLAFAMQGGWDKAPAGYFRRHHGWMVGFPANSSFGTDLMISVCANRSLKR